MYTGQVSHTSRWQDLWVSETQPTCSENDDTQKFRGATVDTIFHIVTTLNNLS